MIQIQSTIQKFFTLFITAITKFNGFSVLLVPVKIWRGNRKEPLQEFSPGTFGSIALADFSALSASSLASWTSSQSHKVKQLSMVIDNSGYIHLICTFNINM